MTGTMHYLPPRAPIPSLPANPSTVTMMRERKGMTRTALAKAVGHSAQWGSKVESGTLLLHGDDLLKVAAHLAVPAAFLTKATKLTEPAGTHFRSYKVTARDRAQARAEANYISHLLHELLSPLSAVERTEVPVINANQFGITPRERGTGAAHFVRQAWGLDGPVANIVGRIEESGLFYAPMPLALTKISGITLARCDEQPRVTLLNNQVPHSTQRFTAAHELGHLVMDATTPLLPDEDVEERANAFASHLLMPFEQIEDQVTGLTPRHIDVLYRVATKWGVHPKAVVQTAALNDAITRDQQRRWFQILNGPEKTQVQQLPVPYRVEPTSAKRLIGAYRNAQWSLSDLAAKLDTNELDLHNLENQIAV